MSPAWAGVCVAAFGAICAALGYYGRYISDKQATKDSIATLTGQVAEMKTLIDQLRMSDAEDRGFQRGKKE